LATLVKFAKSNVKDKALCSYPVLSEVVLSSIMDSDPFVERVTKSDDEVFENYDDIKMYSSRSKINSGSSRDFKVQGRKKK
jgi:hypothetical protein